MINVIRKQSINTESLQISTTDIEALDTGESIILMEPVKQYINISYDANGKPNTPTVNIGAQYDHRVTWLHFDLEHLIWNLDAARDYTADTKYNHYIFKMVVTNLSTGRTSVWEFDGVDFEIPSGVTKEAGICKFTLVIEEFQDKFNGNPSGSTEDLLEGNIRDNSPSEIERFVAAPFKGRVYESIYKPEYDIFAVAEDTNQEAALVKPMILCTLSDDGVFISDENEIGQKYDSFVRYLKFNPRRISAHLNDFNVFAIFKKDNLFYSSLFEVTDPDDPLDDYSASHPIIAWIPKEVYQEAGTWQVAIIACAGKLDDIALNDENGDYYLYVSRPIKMKVKDNPLNETLITQEPILSITTNLTTELGEIIITTEDEIYQASKKEV